MVLTKFDALGDQSNIAIMVRTFDESHSKQRMAKLMGSRERRAIATKC